MTNFVYIATSLDGFIATSDGGLDWLDESPNPEENGHGYAKFMSGIDALVMGRKTFEKVLTFGSWPYDKPVYVLSNGKVTIPQALKNKVEVVSGTPQEVIAYLNGRGHQNLYIDGGVTIQGFLKEDLIDEMIITRIPVLLGNGIPLFGRLTQRLNFKHEKTELINESLVTSHYKRIRD